MLGVEPAARRFAHVEEEHRIPNVLVHMAAGVQSNQPVHMPVGVVCKKVEAWRKKVEAWRKKVGVERKKVGDVRMKVEVVRKKVGVGVRKKVACKFWRELHTMVAWGHTSL